MELLAELNHSQGTTLLIVTHNHEVAQKAGRVITFRDGKIQHDVVLHSAFERQLLDFKSSALGQAIVGRRPARRAARPRATAARAARTRVSRSSEAARHAATPGRHGPSPRRRSRKGHTPPQAKAAPAS